MLEGQVDNVKVLNEASSSQSKPSIVMKASNDAVSVDIDQAVSNEVMFTQAGPEQPQERYAFIVILKYSYLTAFPSQLPTTTQIGGLRCRPTLTWQQPCGRIL